MGSLTLTNCLYVLVKTFHRFNAKTPASGSKNHKLAMIPTETVYQARVNVVGLMNLAHYVGAQTVLLLDHSVHTVKRLKGVKKQGVPKINSTDVLRVLISMDRLSVLVRHSNWAIPHSLTHLLRT